MKRTPRVPGDRLLITIEYMYNSGKVLGFIANGGAGNTELGYPYLSHYTENYSNIYVAPMFVLTF